MGKSTVRLFDLKKWLTLEDAARHLSVLFGEEVVVADVLRLALDGHLSLSIHFVNKARARMGRLVALEDCPMELLAAPDAAEAVKSALAGRKKLSPAAIMERFAGLATSRKLFATPTGIRFTESEWLVLEKDIVTIDGIWDLPLLGAERLDVEHRFQEETGGPEVTLVNLAGAFVRRDETVCQLQEVWSGVDSDSEPGAEPMYIPAGALPENASIVVRTAALREFEQTQDSEPDKKSLDPRERKTLLCIIGALAKAAKLDISSPYKAGAVVEKMLPGQKISARRIGDHLKLVPDALEDRRS